MKIVGYHNTESDNVDDIIAWKKGRFVFSDMSLEAIAHQLERWYVKKTRNIGWDKEYIFLMMRILLLEILIC